MDRMKLIGKFCIVLLTLTFCLRADAQSRESDVFIPIGKYIMQGNADALSAWFDDNLEIKLLSQGGDVSKYGKTTNTGRRGSIRARNFFSNSSHTAMQKAAGELATLIDNLLKQDMK